MTPPDFNGPVELGQKLASSPEFKACFARQLFRFVYGASRRPPTPRASPSCRATSRRAPGISRKGLAALVRSDGFRYRNKGDAP